MPDPADSTHKLIAKVLKAATTEQSKSLSEGMLSGLAFTGAGGDLLADTLPDFRRRWEKNYETFAAFSYGRYKYDTGSSLNVDGSSVLAGLSRTFARNNGDLSFGAFVEAGWGNYDSWNSFANDPDVLGSGDTDYYGGGLALRWDAKGNDRGRFHADGAIRFGRVKNDYSGFLSEQTGFDSSGAYYGGHIGVGYEKKVSDGATVDFYTRLLWTRQEGDSVTLSTGDPVDFDDADSLRWRAGFRFTGASSSLPGVRFYAGAAYEYEFDGDMNATTDGYVIEAPTLKGGSAMGELGLTWAKDGSPLTIDLGVSGYAGQKEGVAGRLLMNWEM
jgi:hypothetical protein